MNLLRKKQELLNNNIFNDWPKYMKLIQSKSYRTDINTLLNNLELYLGENPIITDIETRKFVNAYTMIKFNMLDKNDTYDLHLYYQTVELLETFDNIFLPLTKGGDDVKLDKKLIDNFLIKLKQYFDIYKKWKDRDEKILIDKSCTQQYKEIQVIEQKYNGNTPDEQQLSRSASQLKRTIENRIRQIGGEKALKYVTDSPKLEPLDVMSLDMEEHMKKAYWDMFENDVNNNNLEPICKNLEDFKKYLFTLLGESKRATEIKTKFNNQLDLDLVKQMIRQNAIKSEEIYNIIKTLIFYVKTYVHSASEDSDTEIFQENIYKRMTANKEKIGTILRYFFQNIFTKLDKTKIQMQLLTNKN